MPSKRRGGLVSLWDSGCDVKSECAEPRLQISVFIASFVKHTKGLPADVPAETFHEGVKGLVATVENVFQSKLRKEEEEEQGGNKEGEEGRKKKKEEAKRSRLWDASGTWFAIGCEV